MKIKNSDLQQQLDIQKWVVSEKECMDMCGHMEYCSLCKYEDEYPCAKAYNRFVKANKAKSKKAE